MDGVHSAGATEHAALAAAAVPPRRRAYTAAERIFGSMRFGAEHGVVPMAEQQGALELCIINMTGGGDIDTAVFRTIEACDTFVVLGEDTGNQACTFSSTSTRSTARSASSSSA